MKRLVLGLLLAGFALTARAQSPDSEFLEIYTQIQEGEALESGGQLGSALERFQQAQRGLQAFSKAHPNWNDRIVKFRLGYLEEKLGKISAKTPTLRPRRKARDRAGAPDASGRLRACPKARQAGAE